jgi:hypothetical protein
MRNKTQKKKKSYKYYKKSKKYKKKSKKVLKGGGNIRTSWVGVANYQQPTGFGWLHQPFYRPCNAKY